MKRLAIAILCLLLSLGSVRGQSAEEKQATLEYLHGLRRLRDLPSGEPGGFLPGSPAPESKSAPVSSLRATSAALRALKYFGGKPKDAEGCQRFVAGCFDKASGGFADAPGGKPDVTSTAVGLMALAELDMPPDQNRDAAVKYLDQHAKSIEDIRIAAAGLEAAKARPTKAKTWLEQIAKMRNGDGTYGREGNVARDTGGAVVAVQRLGGEVANRDAVLKALKAGQRPDGGFGKEGAKDSDLDTTYRVMRAFHMLKEKPADVPKLRSFIAACRNADAGYGVAPGQSSSAGGTYYASIILHWLKAK